ncbi:NADH-quinone oxidoreductase subunit A [Venenivibrio stagnispumantis]|uniref:NADH-quinone oxidoreductase subunit A n=1 Tax=Venenivibrio stagnispumantis TaxID=407998 RepID=A0AA45WJ36_9AQUI|nr:NADH-quinone oxidoreductase subunit A [Venenivibrio stagnispumantis]MCW4572518.1 NADH-quinone oxidoreductase subunit A [Venenivibrio stagnispumantis]SMP02015.1 NADH-quinone oxidoreductase subunit A [Venenivibrio stagnispumantis]
MTGTGYLGLAVFFIVATAIGVVLLVLNRLLAPKTPEPLEGYPYECGVPLYDKTARTTIDQKYYLLGLLLVLFDLESAFVFPWAVVFREIAQVNVGFIFTEMFLFLFILILGYIYAWKKGALKWQ